MGDSFVAALLGIRRWHEIFNFATATNYGFIVINAQEGALANVSNLDSDLVKVVLAHEMGHVLGLGHSETSDALMYFDATKKEQLALAQDDMDGLTYLYPRDELSGDNLLGACGVIGGKSPVMRLVTCLLMILPIAFIIRRPTLGT